MCQRLGLAMIAVTVSKEAATNLTYSASMGRSIRAWDPHNSLELPWLN